MSGSSTPQAIPTFANLPVEIVKEICTHLQVAHKCRKEQRDLSSLSLTCRRVYECARTLLWRNLHVTFDQIQPRDDHVLRMLQDIISSLNHPLFLSLNRLHVIMPYYSITTRDSFAKELDKTLGTLIAGAEVLQEIHVDLGIVDAPELHFYNLLDSVLRHESVTSISLLGYAGELPFRAQARPMISHLTLGQIGGSLALDLRSFNSLRRLHLCTDCWDETLSDSNHWQVPPQLWVTLDTFVLEIYGWQPHAEMVMQTVAESVKVLPPNSRIPTFRSFLC